MYVQLKATQRDEHISYNYAHWGLVVSTHQLLSSPIFEYNTLGIMHNGCDR